MKWFIGKCKNLCVTVQFSLFLILNLRTISKYKPPGACIWRGDLLEGFLCYEFGGLIFKGAYFRNFTVSGYVWKEPYSHDHMFIISGLLISDTFAWSREVSLFSIS